MAGVGFDVSQWEIWSTLCAGACLHLVPDEVRPDPAALLAFFAEQRISHAFAPTVMVPALAEQPAPPSLALRYLFCAGEKLPPVATGGLPYTVVDYYGPTEATVFATCRIVDAEAHRRPASIGTPIDGCEAFILDADDRPCHGDRPGELNLAGVCLAREYLRDPDMTARRFPLAGTAASALPHRRQGPLAGRWQPAVPRSAGRPGEDPRPPRRTRRRRGRAVAPAGYPRRGGAGACRPTLR